MRQEIFGQTPIDFVRDGQPMREFVSVDLTKGDPYKPQPGYVPTARVVGCIRCQRERGRATLGTLDFPMGFKEKTGDAIMAGRVIKAYCPVCRNVEEMRALTPQEVRQHLGRIVERYTELYEEYVVKKKCPVVDPGEVLQKVMESRLSPQELKPQEPPPAEGSQPEGRNLIVPAS